MRTMKALRLAAIAVVAPAFLLHSVCSFSAVPTWDALQSLPALSKPLPPIYHDRLPDDYAAGDSLSIPILYRDKDCICAASETVWLGLECKNVEYLTVLVSKDNDEAIPRIEWPSDNDGEQDVTTDPIQLLEQIQARYPTTPPNFYPNLSLAVDASRCTIMRLPGIMPRYSEPSFMDKAPFIFKDDGTLVKKTSHRVSLEEVDETQEEYFLGNYLCGRDVTAADMAWAPYLERYAIQLPLVFPNIKSCNPRSNIYDEVNAWYKTMERLPAYACCVQGDARHWRKCLEDVIPLHNERAESDEEKVETLAPVENKFGWWMTKYPKGVAEKVWKEYAAATDNEGNENRVRPWLADTPAGEVALYLLRNRNDAVAAAATDMDLTHEEADEALREVIQTLADWKMDSDDDNGSLLSENAQILARFASDGLQVPRDVGMIPALALGQLVQSSMQ